MKISFFKLTHNRGFTLTELIVVITIATILMTAVVVQQNSWNDQLVVSTQAYEMALMVRQAQTYGLGVRENVNSSGDKFQSAYGIFFDSDDADWKTRYVFFADVDKNGEYDEGIDQVIETKRLARNVQIDRFCGIKSVGSQQERCSPGNGNVSFMHITFSRPESAAKIILQNSGGNPAFNVSPPAEIYLKSPGGRFYYVEVKENGHISVGANAPTDLE